MKVELETNVDECRVIRVVAFAAVVVSTVRIWVSLSMYRITQGKTSKWE